MAKMDFGKFYDAFFFSVKNQQCFDKYYYSLLNVEFSSFWGVPRPSKWAKRHPVFLSLMRILSPLLAVLWCYLFAYLFIVGKFLAALFRSRFVSRYKKDQLLALAICDRSCIVLSRELADMPGGQSVIWLVPDGVSLSETALGRLSSAPVLASSLLTPSDIIRACIFSLRAHAVLVCRFGIRLSMQSYILPTWASFYFAISKLSPSMIATAEHHDRWAVAADCYCAEVEDEAPCSGLMLVQHGLEYAETYHFITELTGGVGLPYRLRSVRQLYLYNADQSSIFFGNILSNHVSHKNVVLKCISNSMQLTPVSADKISVLFVGHPICEDFHMAVFKELAERFDLDCFYKPHPAARESAKVREEKWQVILDGGFFPAVNFIISYPSTLVAEYDFYNIPAIVHPMDAGDEQLKPFINSIQVKIDSFMME